MFFRRRRRRSGLSLTSLVVLGGILYVTGGGAWLTERIAQLPSACYQSLSGQQAVCSGVEKVAFATVSAASSIGGMLDSVTGRTGGGINLPSGLPDTGGALTGGSGAGINLSGLRLPDWANLNLQSLGSQMKLPSTPQGLMQSGPSISLGGSHSMNDMLRGAVERFALGNQYADPGSVYYSPEKALSWHEQGAQFGDYGFGSQLALGNAYSQGFGGGANAGKATAYLQQALRSLDHLSRSSDPQAQQYLRSFGASPEAMRGDIIKQMKLISNPK